MRILGIDYGTKRIGIAVSDETGTFAMPKTVLSNDVRIMEALGRIIAEEGIGQIVVGDPGENLIAGEVKSFVAKIEKEFGITVVMEKEFMTSLHVSQAHGKKPVARLTKKETGPKKDDSAAALILQRYLDRK